MKMLLLVACVASAAALLLSMFAAPTKSGSAMMVFEAGNNVAVRFSNGVISVVDGAEHIYSTSDPAWTTSPVTKDGRAFSVRVVGDAAAFQVHGDPNLISQRLAR